MTSFPIYFFKKFILTLKSDYGDFPDGRVGKICLPTQGTWFDPWSGKIPNALELLSPHTRAQELQPLSLYAATTETHGPGAYAWQQEKPPQWEARAP